MWYVVQTVAGREFAVCRLIESLVEDDVLQECFVPRYEVQKQFRGQWRTCTATLFPGYLIVVTDRVDELESQLRRVPAFAWVLSNDGGFRSFGARRGGVDRRAHREGASDGGRVRGCDRGRPDHRAEGPAGGPRGLDQEDQPSQAHRVSGDRYVRANHPNENRIGNCQKTNLKTE